jgi:hypothetical protein
MLFMCVHMFGELLYKYELNWTTAGIKMQQVFAYHISNAKNYLF